MTAPETLDLVCPDDGAALEADAGAYGCPSCGGRFPIDRGVVRFMEESDEHYEGRYLHTLGYMPRSERAPFSWPLWLVKSGYVWAVRRFVAAGSTVVEMGCASGVAYFARRYRVVGLDLSFSSLAQVSELYGTCLQADAIRGIPLPDGSVDAIVSSFVWEHIPPESQPALLAECRRVLRPGGRLVFLHDVDPQNPIYRLLKRRDPELFHEIFIVRDDHMGWQSVEANFAAFDRGGFDVLECRGNEKIIFAPPTYDKVGNWTGWLRAMASVGVRFREGIPFHIWNLGLRIFDETIGRMLPMRWSRTVVSVCERRDEAPTATASGR